MKNNLNVLRDQASPMPPFVRELRQAVRDGRKTETRRSSGLDKVNERPDAWAWVGVNIHDEYLFRNEDAITAGHDPQDCMLNVRCPYLGQSSTRYLREPLKRDELEVRGKHFAQYADDDVSVRTYKDGVADGYVEWRWQRPLLTQLHFPKEYARTFLRVVAIEPQRVRDMTEEQAHAEAVAVDNGSSWCVVGHPEWAHATAKGCFETLFDHLNARKKSRVRVADNPWLWRIVFKLA